MVVGHRAADIGHEVASEVIDDRRSRRGGMRPLQIEFGLRFAAAVDAGIAAMSFARIVDRGQAELAGECAHRRIEKVGDADDRDTVAGAVVSGADRFVIEGAHIARTEGFGAVDDNLADWRTAEGFRRIGLRACELTGRGAGRAADCAISEWRRLMRDTGTARTILSIPRTAPMTFANRCGITGSEVLA